MKKETQFTGERGTQSFFLHTTCRIFMVTLPSARR